MQTFDRYEVKYFIPSHLSKKFRQELMRISNIRLDKYNPTIDTTYPISSIYYANENELINRQKEALTRRDFNQRLRLRSYGQVTDDQKVFLEIKKKFNKKTNKRRIELNNFDAVQLLEKNKKAPLAKQSKQVANEIDYMTQKFKLKPYIYIAYDRIAFHDVTSDIRISIDINIRYRTTDLNLNQPTRGKALIDEEYELIEVKTNNGLPIWLIKLLNKYKLRPQSYSKFSKSIGRDNQKQIKRKSSTDELSLSNESESVIMKGDAYV